MDGNFYNEDLCARRRWPWTSMTTEYLQYSTCAIERVIKGAGLEGYSSRAVAATRSWRHAPSRSFRGRLLLLASGRWLDGQLVVPLVSPDDGRAGSGRFGVIHLSSVPSRNRRQRPSRCPPGTTGKDGAWLIHDPLPVGPRLEGDQSFHYHYRLCNKRGSGC